MESKLLSAACADRGAYDLITSNHGHRDFSDKGKRVFEAIGKYYDTDPECKEVDTDILRDRLCRDYPKHAELFSTIINSFEATSSPNIKQELLHLQKQTIKQRIAQACSLEAENDKELEGLFNDFERISSRSNKGTENEVYTSVTAAEVIDKTTGDNLIRLYPQGLNEALGGGVLRKHHIVVFARPDVGKTTFAINFAKGFLRQGLKVLYICNEDPAHHILKRMMSHLLNKPERWLDEHPKEADEILRKRNWDKFYLAELSPGTPREISALVEETEPDVLLVDQARNLDVGDTNRVTQLEKSCQFVRTISKRKGMVGVSFVQAGDSAEGKLVLNMGDVDFSNTGIPSTADLMIGIGCNSDYEMSGRRMLSFPKNKINGNKEPTQVNVEFNTFTVS